MIEIDGARIVRMSKDGIAYLDDEDVEQFINFAACNERYAQETWERYKASENKEVLSSPKSKLRFISPLIALFCSLLQRISPDYAQILMERWTATLAERLMEKYLHSMRQNKNVANRNFTGWPEADRPYIEFYTEPRIRFSFASREEWSKLRSHIQASGWRSFDFA